MNIILVNPPCRTPVMIPLGLAYIASVIRQDGHNVSVLDLNVENRSFPEIERELEAMDFDLIGIGGLTTTYNFVKSLSLLAKKIKPNAKIIAGNMVSTANPELLLQNSQVDICVIDEGEETVRELMQRIKDSSDIDGVKGIAYKKNNQIFTTNPRERLKDLDTLPFPAWDLFAMETYLNNPIHTEYGRRSINVSTVRGCPFQCVYCSRPFGRQVYMRSPANLVLEIKELKRRYRIEYIGFTDDLFMVNRKWVEDVCESFISEKLNIAWGASARVNLVDLGLLRKMRKAGCATLGFGFESGSQKILDNMQKGVTVEQAEKAIAATRKCGITIDGAFMIGMIGETEETVEETVRFIKKTGLALYRFLYTTPYPKTPLFEMAKKMHKIPQDEDKYVSALSEMYSTLLVNLTEMTDERLKDLKQRAEKRIKENFSLKTKLEISSKETRRIYIDLKKRIKMDGILPTLNWFFGKIIEKIRH